MAHSNPEFALGLMRKTTGPVSAEKRDLPTFRDLASRMAAIAELPPDERTKSDTDILRRWEAGRRHIRRAAAMDQSCSIAAQPGGAMGTRPVKGERFVEPRLRLGEVQKDHVKSRRAVRSW